MIYNPEALLSTGKSSIVAHIESEIDDICGSEVDTGFYCEEIGRAIEYYLAQENNARYVNTKSLTMLASRVLASIGESVAARRLIIFGAGMVKPSEWVVSGDRDVWVINLREIILGEESAIELILFRGINLILDTIADVWDESNGEGALGLRHVCQSAEKLLGVSQRTKDVFKLSDEIIMLCVNKLKQLKKERTWSYVPLVLNLDI